MRSVICLARRWTSEASLNACVASRRVRSVSARMSSWFGERVAEERWARLASSGGSMAAAGYGRLKMVRWGSGWKVAVKALYQGLVDGGGVLGAGIG